MGKGLVALKISFELMNWQHKILQDIKKTFKDFYSKCIKR